MNSLSNRNRVRIMYVWKCRNRPEWNRIRVKRVSWWSVAWLSWISLSSNKQLFLFHWKPLETYMKYESFENVLWNDFITTENLFHLDLVFHRSRWVSLRTKISILFLFSFSRTFHDVINCSSLFRGNSKDLDSSPGLFWDSKIDL